jgi:hypothetical protein
MIYAAFKFPRYIRLFEIDSQIEKIVEYFGESRSYQERKSFEHMLEACQFLASTAINLHFFTCMMIVLC